MDCYNNAWFLSFLISLAWCCNGFDVPASAYVATGLVNTHINFTRGSPSCDRSSCPKSAVFMEEYACSDGNGDFEAGAMVFMDPIPTGLYLLQVKAMLYGFFPYNDSSPSIELLVMLQDVILNEFQLNGDPNATCPQCTTAVSLQSLPNPTGWKTYQYGGLNKVIVRTFDPYTFCVSGIDLQLIYGPVSYTVQSLDPPFGPSSGGTVVVVTGHDFNMFTDTWCSFGSYENLVPAIVVSQTQLNCTSPAYLVTTENEGTSVAVHLEVTLGKYGYTNDQVNFTYVIPKPQPPGQPLWIWVALALCLVSVAFVAVIGYVCAKRHARLTPASLIDERSSLINSDKFKQYGLLSPINIKEISILQRVGRGSCAEVYMGSWRGTTVAIKKAKVFADDDESFFLELSQEAELMSTLRHPNVLQFLGTATNPPELLIVMEYMSRGSLYKIIHDKTIELPWSRIRSISLDIARGMGYLHGSNPIIMHRDLKSHNLLVDEHFKVKVADFGLSTMVKQHLDKFTAMTPVGTPCWTAPEVLRNEPYTESADVYSYSVVLWELVSREDPYHGMPTFQIVLAVGQHKLRPTIPSSCNLAFSQLITECWSENAALRPPFAQIVQRLEKMEL